MASSTPGNRYTIRITGDASGPVVAGDDNHVEVHQPPTAAAVPAEPAPPAGPTQTNTAHDHGTVYTVMRGEMHIHHADRPGEAPAAAGEEHRPGVPDVPLPPP